MQPRDPSAFHETGDLGRLDADGFLWLSGRRGDLIKTSTGRRIAPVAVEAALREVAGIDQAVLVGAGRKFLVALCVAEPAAPGGPSAAEVEAGLRAAVAALGPHERPAGILLLAQPLSMQDGDLTPNLKLRRQEIERRRAVLIERLCARIEQRSPHVAGLEVVREDELGPIG